MAVNVLTQKVPVQLADSRIKESNKEIACDVVRTFLNTAGI